LIAPNWEAAGSKVRNRQVVTGAGGEMNRPVEEERGFAVKV